MNTSDLINESFDLRDSGWSNSVDGVETAVHRWYPIKEAFSPKLVQRAIMDTGVARCDVVVDPFCGSGTVPIAAADYGANAVGVEVNPFLAFVSRTKLVRARPSTVRRFLPRIAEAAKQGASSSLERFSTFSSAGGAEKWLFNASVLRSFEGGWQETAALAPATRDLFRLALLRAAMDVCNAKRDGKCLRYKPDWADLSFGRRAFRDAFEVRAEAMIADLSAQSVPRGAARISLGDSRRDLKRHLRGRFKLCVTSPPYLNSFDYSDVYRPELFLGKFVADNAELRALRLKTLRSHVQVDWVKPVRSDFGALYAECVRQLLEREDRLWDHRLPRMVQAYFEDIRGILSWLRGRAANGAQLWMVVSTSAYAGVEIPVDLIIAELGSRVGWNLRDVGVLRDLRPSGQHWNTRRVTGGAHPRLRESVVIFDAPGRR